MDYVSVSLSHSASLERIGQGESPVVRMFVDPWEGPVPRPTLTTLRRFLIVIHHIGDNVKCLKISRGDQYDVLIFYGYMRITGYVKLGGVTYVIPIVLGLNCSFPSSGNVNDAQRGTTP